MYMDSIYEYSTLVKDMSERMMTLMILEVIELQLNLRSII